MASEESNKVAIALLDEVEVKIDQMLGSIASLPPGAEYSAEFDVGGGELIKQCEQAMKKLTNDNENLGRANFLLGRLYAVRTKPGYNRQMLKASTYYKEAIELGFDEAQARYYMALHYRSWNKKQDAINNFQKVVDLEGVDSTIGLDSAKQIEKVKTQKGGGGCFIATAVYGSAKAPEVKILRDFRDKVLVESKFGKVLVSLYYCISPPIARIISDTEILKKIVRKCLIEPIVKLVTQRFRD